MSLTYWRRSSREFYGLHHLKGIWVTWRWLSVLWLTRVTLNICASWIKSCWKLHKRMAHAKTLTLLSEKYSSKFTCSVWYKARCVQCDNYGPFISCSLPQLLANSESFVDCTDLSRLTAWAWAIHQCSKTRLHSYCTRIPCCVNVYTSSTRVSPPTKPGT